MCVGVVDVEDGVFVVFVEVVGVVLGDVVV